MIISRGATAPQSRSWQKLGRKREAEGLAFDLGYLSSDEIELGEVRQTLVRQILDAPEDVEGDVQVPATTPNQSVLASPGKNDSVATTRQKSIEPVVRRYVREGRERFSRAVIWLS
jgi:hypothetical protein